MSTVATSAPAQAPGPQVVSSPQPAPAAAVPAKPGAATPAKAGGRKLQQASARVKRLNRNPLLIAGVMGGAVVLAAGTVAVQRANKKTGEAPRVADTSGSMAQARVLTNGRPDGAIGAKPAPAAPAVTGGLSTPAEPSVQPQISRQLPATTQADPFEELQKRMALQRFERLEQERQRRELAAIQGAEEALMSPTLVDMARGSYARTADRVRNGQVAGGAMVRAGVVGAAPVAAAAPVRAGTANLPAAVRTSWSSSSGGPSDPATTGSTVASASPTLTGIGGGTTGPNAAYMQAGAGDYGGSAYGGQAYGGYAGGYGPAGYGNGGGLSPAYLGAIQQSQGAVDPNAQSGKLRFLDEQRAPQGYLAYHVQAPLSPYEVKKGSVIPATMIAGVNSDLPGRMIAQVSQDVYDSATGRYLLIPQGSRLFGRYDSGVTYGQERVLVVWTDLTFPDGSTLHLGSMAGTDQAGYGGFADQVDDHAARTYGSAILLSLLGAGSEYAIATARAANGGNTYISLGQAGVENASSTFGSVVRQSFQKNLNVQPTIEIRPGYRFNVIVDKDIVFPPYAR